jgi:hypothetical protein
LNELIESLLLIDWHRVDLCFQGFRGIGFEIDRMVPRLVFWKSVGFGFREDFYVTLVFLGDEFFKRFLNFAFTGFHSKFGRQSIVVTDPDFIEGVCDDPGFDPSLVFQAIGFENMGRRWSKLFWAVRNLYLTRIPVYSWVDFIQLW